METGERCVNVATLSPGAQAIIHCATQSVLRTKMKPPLFLSCECTWWLLWEKLGFCDEGVWNGQLGRCQTHSIVIARCCSCPVPPGSQVVKAQRAGPSFPWCSTCKDREMPWRRAQGHGVTSPATPLSSTVPGE